MIKTELKPPATAAARPVAERPNVVGPTHDGKAKLALGLLMLGYIVVVGRAAWIKLDALGMGFDLGMYEQVIWNTAHGHLFATTAFSYTTNHLGSDVILLELLLAPLYALLPFTQTLLLAQTVVVALGALPLYLLARDRLGSAWAGVGVAAAYLAYLPLIDLNLYEFQPRAFALVCILFALYFLDRASWRPMMLFLALSLATRSDVALLVAMVGVVAFLWRRPWRYSLAPVLLGAAWFLLAVLVVVPHFKTTSGGFVYAGAYDWLGKTPSEMLMTMLTRPLWVLQNVLQPGKLQFVAQIFGPTWPFSLLRPDVLLLAGPSLAVSLLSPYSVHWTISHQYGALLYPIAFTAAVLGLAWLSRRPAITAHIRRSHFIYGSVALLLVLTIGENLIYGNPAVGLWKRGAAPRLATARALIASVPQEAGLAVTNHVGPLAGRRSKFYFFPPHTFYTSNPMDVADYILVDSAYDGGDPDTQAAVETLRRSPGWRLTSDRDGYLLFQRGNPSAEAVR